MRVTFNTLIVIKQSLIILKGLIDPSQSIDENCQKKYRTTFMDTNAYK